MVASFATADAARRARRATLAAEPAVGDFKPPTHRFAAADSRRRAAAFRMATNEAHEAALRTAAFWAADAGHRVAHTVVHLHGGVGLDEDHPVHRYFLAAKHHEFLLGSATEQLRALGRELADSPV